MDNLYEITTILLGVWVVVLHLSLKSKRRQAQRLIYSLDMIAHKQWAAVETEDGFKILNQNGETAMSVADKTKGAKHG